MLTENSVLDFCRQIEVSDLNGEKVMIDFQTGKYYCLKGVANDIWDFMCEKKENIKVSDIVAKLLEEYEIDKETCTAEVVKFLTTMEQKQFIKVTM